jgi:hypothetical protein
MPIRFRCPHCNQLMGIARRKSGSMVHCPTCNTAVLVPMSDEAEEGTGQAPSAPTAPSPVRELFERDDFDNLLNAPSSAGAEPRNSAPGMGLPEVEPPPSLPPLRREPVNMDAWPASQPPPALTSEPVGGVVLSPTRATILTVVVILLLAIAFGGGLIVGRFYLG